MKTCWSKPALCCAGLAVLLLIGPDRSSAQIQKAAGQNVVPVYEGWERNADGSFNMVFGYMNRNYEEQLNIPIGPENSISPGPADQGQPTHFYRRRQQFVFKIRVPKDSGQKDLVWTLTSRGATEKAYGSLLPIWELGNLVYQENRGGLGVMTWPEEPNEAPSIEMVGSSQLSVTLPETLNLTVEVSDDGHPKPRVRRAGAANVVRDSDGAVAAAGGRSTGIASAEPVKESPLSQAVVKLDPGVRLGVTWVLYRGPAPVEFEPMHVAVAKLPAPGVEAKVEHLEGKATTKVTFTQPGTYRLRCYADDSVLITPLDVIVTVKPAQ
jgi:hypothetical protein